MLIESIGLANFRNYRALSLRPAPGVTLLLGDNAQGKTNLLEAVSLASTGRSHRTRVDKEFVLWGEKQAALSVEVRHRHAAHQVRMSFFSGAQRRQVLVNQAPIARSGELMGWVNTVLFAPEDLALIQGGPQGRRRFMDIELSQGSADYFYALQRYMRILKQRNALLRAIPRNPSSRALLDVWDEQLCAAAPPLYKSRAAFADSLSQLAAQRHREISSGREELSCAYRSSPEAPETLAAALFSGREEDIRRGATLSGPHRDDLILRIDGRDARTFASQGQQRTAALSLKLSELALLREQTGECPILLLDDVMSELDPRRRDALLEHMRGVQTLVTAASLDFALPSDAQVVRIQAGEAMDGQGCAP